MKPYDVVYVGRGAKVSSIEFVDTGVVRQSYVYKTEIGLQPDDDQLIGEYFVLLIEFTEGSGGFGGGPPYTSVYCQKMDNQNIRIRFGNIGEKSVPFPIPENMKLVGTAKVHGTKC